MQYITKCANDCIHLNVYHFKIRTEGVSCPRITDSLPLTLSKSGKGSSASISDKEWTTFLRGRGEKEMRDMKKISRETLMIEIQTAFKGCIT